MEHHVLLCNQVRLGADIEDTCVSVKWMLSGIEEALNCTAVVLLDACRPNPFLQTWASPTQRPATGMVLPLRPVPCCSVCHLNAPFVSTEFVSVPTSHEMPCPLSSGAPRPVLHCHAGLT